MDEWNGFDVSPALRSRKRKHVDLNNEELEIQIDAPEPASKKALRKARQGKSVVAVKAGQDSPNVESVSEKEKRLSSTAPLKRSEYGIWIGNLGWSATKADVRSFITSNTDIADVSILRLNMPVYKTPRGEPNQNKGFAYIDFSTESELTQALALTEKSFLGRPVLIKNADSFEGRPEKSKQDTSKRAPKLSGKPPSKSVFVDNIPLDASKEDLQEHFTPCGTVTDVRVMTFEGSEKSNGCAWVKFADSAAAEAAVRGSALYNKERKTPSSDEADDNEGENKEENGPPQPRKRWFKKFKGRVLRIGWGEGRNVLRDQKRYDEDASARNNHESKTVQPLQLQADQTHLSPTSANSPVYYNIAEV